MEPTSPGDFLLLLPAGWSRVSGRMGLGRVACPVVDPLPQGPRADSAARPSLSTPAKAPRGHPPRPFLRPFIGPLFLSFNKCLLSPAFFWTLGSQRGTGQTQRLPSQSSQSPVLDGEPSPAPRGLGTALPMVPLTFQISGGLVLTTEPRLPSTSLQTSRCCVRGGL